MQVLSEIDADIVALEEVVCLEGKAREDHQARYIAEELGYHVELGENRQHREVSEYRRVWSMPMCMLAKDFGLSDVGLAKICEKHHIPRAPVGHWVHVERGHHPEQTPLPDIEDADLDVVNITIREKSLDILGQNLDPQVQAMLVPAVIAVQSDRIISHPLILKKLLAHPRKDAGFVAPQRGEAPVASQSL